MSTPQVSSAVITTASDTFRSTAIHSNRYSQVSIGSVTDAAFGGGTLLIQRQCGGGQVHTIRSLNSTEFNLLTDKTLRLEAPPKSVIQFELTGSTAGSIFIEHNNQVGAT